MTKTNASQVAGDTVVTIDDLEVWFEMERGRSVVVDGVDLELNRGEILGIVGESGSGKSMLASAMLDSVVEPGRTSGSIRHTMPSGETVDVLDLDQDELRRFRWSEVSMVFQGAMSSFNPTMKIRDHFEETLAAHEQSREVGMDRARRLLEDLYLEPDRVLESYPHELSGGMQQRTLIALSMILEPSVLVLDEPTAALDLLMQRSILTLLEQLQREYDVTLVFITHDLPLVASLADRLAIMYAFELVERGPTDEILWHAAHPYTRALLNATPNLDTPLDEMESVEGSSPDPIQKPSGCAYHPRCPLADERCAESAPPDYDVSPDHSAACFYWDDAADAIPFTTEGK